MSDFPHLAQRLFNTPLALLPEKAEVIMAALADRLGVVGVFRSGGRVKAMDQEGEAQAVGAASEGRRAGYDVVRGVGVIGVQGTLVQRNGYLRPTSGMTGYDGLRVNFLQALADPEVEAIAFDIDSPGGEVAGCFDLVDTIHAARGQKPIWAILSESAYSAAYAIASAADRITVPRTGGTGSVGVIFMHVSMEEALAEAGLEVTIITKGDLKGDGSQFRKLGSGAYRRMRADILEVGDLFDATVARNRGLRQARVFDTQAGTFLGGRGVDIGFADDVMAPDAAFRALLKELG